MIADFGIARAALDPSITASGELLGTAAHLAPEQVQGGGESVETVARELAAARQASGDG